MTDGVGEIVVFTDSDGRVRVQVRLEEGSVWLSQAQMAELYGTTPQNITQHIRAIYAEGEHDLEATCKPCLQVRREGSRDVQRSIKHYNLSLILAVGFRVRSPVGTRFRRWATKVLGEFAVKGFSMDDRRLMAAGSDDYFDELLARVRDIRASERVFWRKVLDIYATSVDYDASAEASRRFFQTARAAAPRRRGLGDHLRESRAHPAVRAGRAGGWAIGHPDRLPRRGHRRQRRDAPHRTLRRR